MSTFTIEQPAALLQHPAGRGYLNTTAAGLAPAAVVEALQSALDD